MGWKTKGTWFYIKIVFFVFLFCGVVFVGKLIFFPMHIANTALNSATEIVDKTLDSGNVIYNYEWFKSMKEEFTKTKNQIKNAIQQCDQFAELAGDRSSWAFEDRTEYSRLNSVVLGLQNHLEDVRAQYNARSSMANRNIFKTSELPDSL